MLTSLFNSTSSFTFTFSDIPWTTMSVAYSNGDYYVAYGGVATAPSWRSRLTGPFSIKRPHLQPLISVPCSQMHLATYLPGVGPVT